MDDVETVNFLTERIQNARLVAIYGGPASGKTTLAEKLAANIGNTVVVGTDNFVIGTRAWRRANLEGIADPREKYDLQEFQQKIAALLSMQKDQTVRLPVYNEMTGEALAVGEAAYPTVIESPPKLVIVEGDFDFFGAGQVPDVTIYLDASDETRLARRLARDMQKRNATEEDIIANFNLRQESQFIPYTKPLAAMANYIVAHTGEVFVVTGRGPAVGQSSAITSPSL